MAAYYNPQVVFFLVPMFRLGNELEDHDLQINIRMQLHRQLAFLKHERLLAKPTEK